MDRPETNTDIDYSAIADVQQRQGERCRAREHGGKWSIRCSNTYSLAHELRFCWTPWHSLLNPSCTECYHGVCDICYGPDRGVAVLFSDYSPIPSYDYLCCTQCWKNPQIRRKVWWKNNYPTLWPVIEWFYRFCKK